MKTEHPPFHLEHAASCGRRLSKRRRRALASRVLHLIEKARALYQKKDDLFQQLLDACPAGTVIETAQGRFEIVDNFAAKNVGYRPASFHRFELKEVKTAKQGSRKEAPGPQKEEPVLKMEWPKDAYEAPEMPSVPVESEAVA